MYRAASSRIKSLKGHICNKTVSKFTSTSTKLSSGGLFSWFTGGSSWRLPPLDFPLKGELPSSLPDDIETKITTLPDHSLDREIVGQQMFPSFLVSLLGGGGSFSRLFSEVVGIKNQCELALDGGFKVPNSGGFDAPDINAFGHTFRNYDYESERQKQVEELYKMNHINQTYDFVKRMREEYKRLDKLEMSIWECCELLNEVVDDSDPDLDEPQIEHLLQSAEAIRKDYPNEDWLHLTALIHDLGKVLLLPRFGALPQWAVVGDTHPLGCAFDESIVHHKYFKENPDSNNPAYQTKNGIYPEGCGLDNVMISWGHDDYMYLVAKENGTTLPQAGLFIIRYHSFYPLHSSGAYKHLMNEEDVENLKWLQIFNKYDLYSKSKVRVDIEKVKPYYQSLIAKYFPEKLRW